MMGAGDSTEIEESLPFATSGYYEGLMKGEQPQHAVVLTQPFYMGVHEVSQDVYREVTGTNPSWFATGATGEVNVAGLSTDKFPVEMVSWDDAIDFCNQLSEREGLDVAYVREEGPVEVDSGLQNDYDARQPHPGVGDTVTLRGTGYRLPTEARWEFSCQAGTTTRFWSGNTNEDLLRAGWFDVNNEQRTHAIGELQANPFGLHDVHGNVWEWVHDRSGMNAYLHRTGPLATDPIIRDSTNEQRTLRGGDWNDPAVLCRSAVRPTQGRMHRIRWTGFRMSLTVDAVMEALASESSEERSSSDGVEKAFTDAP
ncbi:MAG TPA: formylglycine-generating enzyme family protein [Planctomycetes bacterium]|nr:formylglycine-generating enzyme family protein [Fuerstiella sp.]HIK96163.1 formylglycine-generating enzyme family protein [Planctomycetota bacterium]